MAKDKARRSAQNSDGRESGGFIALPWAILDSPDFIGLSHPAKSLLLEFARQHYFDKREGSFTNGRLLANSKTLNKRGWKSKDTLTRAKRELINKGFLFETVKGHKPNKAGWYALTWFSLPRRPNYDYGIQYKRFGVSSNTCLIPSSGIRKLPITPPDGLEVTAIRPPQGLVMPILTDYSVPSHGNLSRVSPSIRKNDGVGGV